MSLNLPGTFRAPASAARLPAYTPSQVAGHAARDDCWVVVGGAVCDVTDYVQKHPGGAQLVFRHAGQDCTADFEGMFHSQKARALVAAMQVGRLVPEAAGEGDASRKTTVKRFSTSSAGRGRSGSKSNTPPKNRRFVVRTAAALAKDADGFAVPPPPGPAPKAEAEAGPKRPWSERIDELKVPCDDADADAAEPRSFEASLVSVARLGDDSARFRFAPGVAVPAGMHVTVAVPGEPPLKRQYTPTASSSDALDLVVRSYPTGGLSQRLAEMRVGERLRVTGPCGAFRYAANRWARVSMVAAGTGITPLYQIMQVVACSGGADRTALSLVYANRTTARALLADEIDVMLRRPGSGVERVRHVVSRPETPAEADLAGRVSGDAAGAALLGAHLYPPAPGTLAMVCGPDGFCRAAVAALALLGYAREQVHVF